jgi:hypothetical protein
MDDLCGRQWNEVEGKFLSFQAGKAEEILNQTSQPVILLSDKLEVLASLPFLQLAGVQQGVHQHPHGGKWCSELVRHRRCQIVLESRQGHLPTDEPKNKSGQNTDHR